MQQRRPSASPSAVTAERQSTTVPNTSCTNAWISLMACFSLRDTGEQAGLGGEAEDAAPVELEAPVLRLAAHKADIDLLDDDSELEGGEDLVPANRCDIEAGARGIALDRLGAAREAVAPGRHRRDIAPLRIIIRLDPV